MNRPWQNFWRKEGATATDYFLLVAVIAMGALMSIGILRAV